MAIYIPGVSMPKDGECVVVLPGGVVQKYKAGGIAFYAYQDRTEEAVAVQLPPHGRLGDLDALTHTIEGVDWYHQNEEKDMVHGANSFLHQAWYKEQDVYRAIEGASTIIPAEGGSGNV